MKHYTVKEAYDKFPELRDRYNEEDLQPYRAIIFYECVNNEATVPYISRWLEGEQGFLDNPKYDVLVEFPDEYI